MFSKTVVLSLAFVASTSALPSLTQRDDCQASYNSCVANGTPEVICSCDQTACLGEDNARNREWCSSATATLVATPTPTPPADPCQATYTACVAAGTPEVACSCDLTACLGEDSARIREWCSSATATLVLPSSTSIPGGCNPAHPGSCPSSYFTYTIATPTPTAAA